MVNEIPHSIEAEQAVIGALIAEPELISSVIDTVKSEYFYSKQHKDIYETIISMFLSNLPIDVITILNTLEKRNIFNSSSEGKKYLTEIADILPSTSNIASYCKILEEKYKLRSLLNITNNVISDVDNGKKADEIIDTFGQRIYDISQGNVKGLSPLNEILLNTYEEMGKMNGEDRNKYLGMKTGFVNFDKIISGLKKSDLIVIAARPAMGKTAFALNIAANVARTNKDKTVAIFSLEMSDIQLATRLISTEACVSSSSISNGLLTKDDWVKIASAANHLSTMPIYIDDTSSISVQHMKANLRCIKNLGLVVIDYLQLIGSAKSYSENRVNFISEITRNLKVLAKELNVPIILISQLSRNVENRVDKRPMLSDLRESGSIEQDADIVVFLYRDDYYNDKSQEPNVCECIIAKNRHGKTGKVKLAWNSDYTRFANLSPIP